MKKLLPFLVLLLAPFAKAQATDASQGFCYQGGQSALVSGLPSTNKQLAIIPKCTVTVYLTGTLTKATIFADKNNSPLSNPFTADALGTPFPGKWIFFANSGVGYDVVMSGGVAPLTYTTSFTLTDVKVGGGGGGACSGTFQQIAFFPTQNTCTGDPLFLDKGTVLGGGLVYTGNGANFDAENSGSYSFTANDPSSLNGASNTQFNLTSNGVTSANFGVTTSSNGTNSGNISLTTTGSSTNGDNIFLTALGTGGSASGKITIEGQTILVKADTTNMTLQSVGGINLVSGSQPTTFRGGIAPKTTLVTTTPYTIPGVGETTTLYNAGSGNIVATLPNTGTLTDGIILIQKKVDSSANTVTVTPNGGAIDGAGSFVLKFQYQWVALQYDAAIGDWHVFATGPAYTGALTPNDCVQVNATGNGFVDSGAGCGGGGGGGAAFNAITSGSNTTAAMVVGTGASLTRSGTGSIDASKIGGISITGTPSIGQIPIATSSSAATWQAAPGAPSFSVITSGTNTGAAMLVGTGASMGVTGSGTIGATTAIALATAPSTCGSGQYSSGIDVNGNAFCGALPTQPASQYIAPQPIAGCGVEYVSGLTYNIGACTYSINGTIYHSPLTSVTLSAADPTNPRLDVIYVDTTQTVQVIPGVPATTPQQPVVDPSAQLELTFVLVPAAATTPGNTTLVDIYLEGVEWVGAKGGTNGSRVNLTSTSNPFSGTHDTEFGVGGTVANTTFAGYTVPSSGTVNLSNYNTLTFYIRNKAAFLATNSVTVQWFNGTTQKGTGVVLSNGAFGFNATTNTTTYQQISIPTTTFGIAGIPVTSVRFTVSGTGAPITGFYLDQITLQGGSGSIVLPTTLMNFKGAWSSTATYNPNDTVTFGGIGYVALAQNTNVATSTASTWAPLAQTGVVSSFSAPSASWPTWLVPTVTTPTSTPSLAVAAGPIPYSALTSIGANTVLGALTPTTPSALSVPSCSGANQALNWTSGVGYGCATIAGGGGGGNTTSTSLTNNFLPKANGVNSIIDSALKDTGSQLVYSGTGTVNSFSLTEGTTDTPVSGQEIINANSSTHTMNLSSNGGAFSPICTVANGQCAASSGAPNIIIASVGNASVAGCTLNSNLLTGGGTVQSACAQAQLDWLAANYPQGSKWILNGPLLLDQTEQGTTNSVDGNVQTTCLQMHANQTIDASQGGVFLKANSNCTMLGNNISGNVTSSTWQKNITVIGGFWNGNNANQSIYEQGNSANTPNFGFWFGGFNGLTINNVTLYNVVEYNFVLSNGTNFVMANDTETVTTTVPGNPNNQDGIHMFGTLTNGYIYNFTDNGGDDDPLAFNTDELVFVYNLGPGRFGYNRFTPSGGAMNNIIVNGANFNGTATAGRFIGYSTSGGVATVSNIVLKNIYGTATADMLNSGITAGTAILVDNWQVSRAYSFPAPFTAVTCQGGTVPNASCTPLSTIALSENSLTVPAVQLGASQNYGVGYSTGNLLFFTNGILAAVINDSVKTYRIPSDWGYTWASCTNNSCGSDTGLSREAAGVVDLGNGTAGDKSGTLKLASVLASGIADGKAPVTITTGTTATLGGTFKSGYTLNQEATAATAVAYTLPTAAAGLQYCIGNSWNGSAATTGVLTLNTSASGQFIIFTDGTLTATGGNVTSGGAAADAACVVGVDATHWQLYVQRGTWTKH